METYEIPFSEAMKRFWRRRYQRLPNGTGGRQRLKVARLGGVGDGRMTTTIMGSTRSRLKISALFYPIRLLARVHDAYVETMMGKSVGVSMRKIAARKRACKETQVTVASRSGRRSTKGSCWRFIGGSRQLVAEL